MSDKGETYTIVVDKNKDIISVTYNGGPPMTKEGEGNPPIELVDRDARGVPVDIDPPQGYSGCICLGVPEKKHGGTCVWKWGKLF